MANTATMIHQDFTRATSSPWRAARSPRAIQPTMALATTSSPTTPAKVLATCGGTQVSIMGEPRAARRARG